MCLISLRLCTVCSDIAVYVQGAPEPALWHAVTAIARDRRAIDIEDKENACATYIVYIRYTSSRSSCTFIASKFVRIGIPVGVTQTSIDIGSGAATLHLPCAPLHREELPGEE